MLIRKKSLLSGTFLSYFSQPFLEHRNLRRNKGFFVLSAARKVDKIIVSPFSLKYDLSTKLIGYLFDLNIFHISHHDYQKTEP